jgi:hypothetical protein
MPNGDAVSLNGATAIIHSPKKGVLVKGDNGQAIAWVPEKDDARAFIVRAELIKAVEAAQKGRTYQPDWSQLFK